MIHLIGYWQLVTDTEPEPEIKTGMEKYGDESALNHKVNMHGRQDLRKEMGKYGEMSSEEKSNKR